VANPTDPPLPPPICLPREIVVRYAATGDQQLLAAVLLETYLTEHHGEGTGVFVPEAQVLERLAWDQPRLTNPRERLRQALALIATQERVGARVEHGMVNVWFSPDIEKRVKSYQALPWLEAS
jgi:hypothetical protein